MNNIYHAGQVIFGKYSWKILGKLDPWLFLNYTVEWELNIPYLLLLLCYKNGHRVINATLMGIGNEDFEELFVDAV